MDQDSYLIECEIGPGIRGIDEFAVGKRLRLRFAIEMLLHVVERNRPPGPS